MPDTHDCEAPLPPPLLQLPSDVLRTIWQRLKPQYSDDGCYEVASNQLPLRATCRALLCATTPFISRLHLTLQYPSSQRRGHVGLLHDISCGLDRFPRACTLQRLHLNLQLREEEQDLPLDTTAWLPNLLMDQRQRLSGLLHLNIEGDGCRSQGRNGQIPLTFGGMAAIAMACPCLQELHVYHPLCGGPLFAALSQLQSLRVLSLICLDIPLPGQVPGWSLCSGVLASLSTLTQLTQLRLRVQTNSPEPGLCLDDLLPPLLGLSTLQHLDLWAPTRRPDDLSPLQHLTHLPGLHTLNISAGNRPSRPLSAHDLQFLALPATAAALHFPRLRSLDLHNMKLDDSALRLLLAQLPTLRELEASGLRVRSDCTALPCTWTKLCLRACPSPEDLLRLPAAAVQALEFDFWNFSVRGDQGALVRRAAQLLARGHDVMSHASLAIRRKGGAALHCDDVLAALAPLRETGVAMLRLDGWQLGPEAVRQLALSLPRLFWLGLVDCRPSMAALRALVRLAALSELRLLCELPAPESPELALMTLATGRWQIDGPVLEVVLGAGAGYSEEQLEQLNTSLALMKPTRSDADQDVGDGSGDAGGRTFTGSSYVEFTKWSGLA